ncbi:hypothetical protein [Actinoplanes sp. NPDC051851]|uniref:hypothetical protein n=1 Tax=Actinoplanes sp. NPDC051851 TaxID=3154753 RepID=UPI0034459A3E
MTLRGSNGVAFGPDGRLYVAEFLAGRISAVDLATGDVEPIVPPGGPIQAPDDLAFDSSGAMVVTDLVPGRVWRRAPDGTFTLVADGIRAPNGIACADGRLFVNEMVPGGRLLELTAGRPVVLATGLAMGNAMQVGPDGCLYYPHMLTGEIYRLPLAGSSAPELVTQVDQPVAVRFDRAGLLHVLSRDAAGTVTVIGDDGRTVLTTGVIGIDNGAVDDENRIFVSSYARGGITELLPGGRTREIVPPGLCGPFGVTIDLAGKVHAADHYRMITADGGTTELHTFAHGIAADGDELHLTSQFGQIKTYHRGSRQVRTRASGLDQPGSVCVRRAHELIVAESGAGRVIAVDAADRVTVLAEGLGLPTGLAVDAAGRVHVSDEERGAVYRLDDDGPFLITDGLDTPQGLAIDGDDLLIVETGRRRLLAVGLPAPRTGGDVRAPASGPARPGLRVLADDLPVGLPPREQPALFAEGLPGLPGVPRPFAGLAVADDGTIHLAADGEGRVLQIRTGDPDT